MQVTWASWKLHDDKLCVSCTWEAGDEEHHDDIEFPMRREGFNYAPFVSDELRPLWTALDAYWERIYDNHMRDSLERAYTE